MLTIAETDIFTKLASDLFTDREIDDLKAFLALNPEAGDVIQGTGGLRKLRWQAKQKGKRGGARVIYFYYHSGHPLHLLLAYGKNAQDDLTSIQRQACQDYTDALRKAYGNG